MKLSAEQKAAGLPIRISGKDFKAVAGKAYKEKRLSAQGATPRCVYRDPSGRPCVVGVVMTEAQYQAIPKVYQSSYVGNLIETGIIKTTAPVLLLEAQRFHDGMIPCAYRDERELRAAEAKLAKLLGVEVNV